MHAYVHRFLCLDDDRVQSARAGLLTVGKPNAPHSVKPSLLASHTGQRITATAAYNPYRISDILEAALRRPFPPEPNAKNDCAR